MGPKFTLLLICSIFISVVILPIDSTNRASLGVGKGATLLKMSAIKKAKAAKAVALPLIPLASRGFLAGSLAVPLLIGKTATLSAIPMGIGALIGAPIGATIGATAGAIKGALIAKGLVGAKLLAMKGLAVTGAAIAAKPLILAAGVKTKVAGAGIGLIGKGVGAAGKAVVGFGQRITSFSKKVKGLTDGLVERLNPLIALPALPSLPELTSLLPKPVLIESDKPKHFRHTFSFDHPFTGYKFGNMELYSSRSRGGPLVQDVPEHVPVLEVIPESRGVKGYSDFQQIPETIQQLPEPVQQLPEPVQQLPEFVQQLPELVQQLPEPVQQLPEPVQQLHEPVQQFHEIQQISEPLPVKSPVQAQEPLPDRETIPAFEAKPVSEPIQSLNQGQVPSPDASDSKTGQLLRFIKSKDAQQCLSRVICELSADPTYHGSEGIRFGRSLLLLESQTDKSLTQQFRDAANAGAQSGGVNECRSLYPSCGFASNEIIRIGNQMIDN